MADPIQQLMARVAALESQSQALKQQLRGSIGVSTGQGGALNIRTTQLGFPAELTSTYDATTGYSWKRKRLEPPTFVNPGVQLTGNKAFEATSSTSVASGTSVWMEPSPDGVGYVFQSGGSSGSLASGLQQISQYNISSTTFTSTGDTVTIPSDGTYLLYYSVNGAGKVSGISILGAQVSTRLYDATFGAVVPNTRRDVCGVAFAGYDFFGSGAAIVIYGATSGTVIRLEAAYSMGSIWSSANICGQGEGEMGYIKLA